MPRSSKKLEAGAEDTEIRSATTPERHIRLAVFSGLTWRGWRNVIAPGWEYMNRGEIFREARCVEGAADCYSKECRAELAVSVHRLAAHLCEERIYPRERHDRRSLLSDAPVVNRADKSVGQGRS